MFIKVNLKLNATATRAVSLKPHTSGRITFYHTAAFNINQSVTNETYNICTKVLQISPLAASLDT